MNKEGQQMSGKIHGNIFQDLFVLELANNHWGDLDRGLKIISDFAKVAGANAVKTAIKLQIRDVDNFIHKDYKYRQDIRYIKKTMDTKMSKAEYAAMIDKIKECGCIAMATPFDEASVDLCIELGVDILKMASSDINDWFLIEKIAKTNKPVIASTGGARQKNIDDMVLFFQQRNIPVAINHCISLYPSEKCDLELNQIDFLKKRYPDQIIGFSTHESGDLTISMLIAYAKGARTFERHIDIEADGIPVSPYCSTPEEIDRWFKAYHTARQICGASTDMRRILPKNETEYLDALVRGVYLKRDLPKGHIVTNDDVYLAIPLLKGQLSCREIIEGQVLATDIKADQPLKIDYIDNQDADPALKELVYNRGMDENK